MILSGHLVWIGRTILPVRTLRVFLKFDLGQLPGLAGPSASRQCPGPGGARAHLAEGMETNSSARREAEANRWLALFAATDGPLLGVAMVLAGKIGAGLRPRTRSQCADAFLVRCMRPVAHRDGRRLEGQPSLFGALRTWSDFHCTTIC